jgi:phosphatidylglycerophosphate synthase
VASAWLSAPNLLTLARVPLVIPAAWLLWRGEYRAVAVTFLAAAVATDVLDGLWARRRGAVTDLGKKLDPVADKVAVALVGVVLVLKYGVPWWLLAATVARDVAILVTATFVIKKFRRVPASNLPGKAAALAMAVYAVAVIVAPGAPVTAVFLWLVVGFIVVSSAGYLYDVVRAARPS